jgi:hypothetical protein
MVAGVALKVFARHRSGRWSDTDGKPFKFLDFGADFFGCRHVLRVLRDLVENLGPLIDGFERRPI